jgi:hypothetical protein
MTRSKHRGHDIEVKNNAWVYSDNHNPVSRDKGRSCGHCGKDQTVEGHDGCIGTLPGVMNACCGHGDVKACYVSSIGLLLSGVFLLVGI